MPVKENQLIDEISDLKKQIGSKLLLLGHYYQRKEIVDLADFKGDSFALSKKAANLDEAEYIIFCGVHFMAESAAILAKPNQIVQIPDQQAGCPMADMAKFADVENAWTHLKTIIGNKKIIPITYMNSTAEIKSFCGANDGTVCTSSNADKIFRWALEQGDKIFFMPDEHLGRNTANKLGIEKEKVVLWDPHYDDGNLSSAQIETAKVILWKGFCHIHTFFEPEHIDNIRNKFPDAVIIAHPECKEEVIDMVDFSGSTGFIDKYVANAKTGSTIAIATEINMIDRLSREYPDLRIIEVARSLCTNMFKIDLEKLKTTMLNLGKHNIVTVNYKIKYNADRALRKMIQINDNY